LWVGSYDPVTERVTVAVKGPLIAASTVAVVPVLIAGEVVTAMLTDVANAIAELSKGSVTNKPGKQVGGIMRGITWKYVYDPKGALEGQLDIGVITPSIVMTFKLGRAIAEDSSTSSWKRKTGPAVLVIVTVMVEKPPTLPVPDAIATPSNWKRGGSG